MNTTETTTPQEKPMCVASIKKKLELVASCQAYLNFLSNASLGEHVSLKLGDQLRATEDYNGAIFEVVKEPYECVVDAEGKLSDYTRKYKQLLFRSFQEEEAKECCARLLANREADAEGWEIEEARVVKENHPMGPDDDEHSDDEWFDIDAETYHFRVCWTLRTLPADHKKEQRVWVRKICLISKAEGQTDDKNYRSLTLSQKTIQFKDLIRKQQDILYKCSRSLDLTRPTDKRTKKSAGWIVNKEKLDKLNNLYNNPVLNKRTLTAFANTKYGCFLRNPVTYTITASGKNVVTATTDKLFDGRKDVKATIENKNALVKQLQGRDPDCLIEDD